MKKALFLSTLLATLFLIVGTYAFPTQPVMWLAGISVGYTILRSVLALVLLAVLCTEPPRQLYMRLVMGGAALLLVGTGIALSMGNSMHLLDIVLFMEVGIVLGIEALELNEEELRAKVVELQAQQLQQRVLNPAGYFHMAIEQATSATDAKAQQLVTT